ncbi:MAG: SAM-dependent methyltransferase [Opitutaceae bacterium]
MPVDSRSQFLDELRAAVKGGTLVKLTLGRHRGEDKTLRNLFVRPVRLKAGPMLACVWRHATREVARNYPPDEGLKRIEPLIGVEFLDAHLFTSAEVAQLECAADGTARLRRTKRPDSPQAGDVAGLEPAAEPHDRPKDYVIGADAPWLAALGVTRPGGRPREAMAAKFRQIQKFAELLTHFAEEAGLGGTGPLSVFDMGCGKGYLTFAAAAALGGRARVRGIEARPELVEFCNRVASEQGFGARLSFAAGTIAGTPLDRIDILIALHACDTATDDALARGIAAGARLLLVAPCCQKELRPQLTAPPVLARALRHGIFQERQAEFATDALRAQLLEWEGYRTQAFEFVPTEHTAKNLMIAAIRKGGRDEKLAPAIREFAAFYGIRRHSLARQLGFELDAGSG